MNSNGRSKNEAVGNVSANIQQAIRKIESMQLYNGGLPFWPEGGSAAWWPTIYATHFLLEAQQAGYDVNARILDGLMKFLLEKVKQKDTETYFYYENNVRKSRVVPHREIPYSIFILAMADKAPITTMNFYKSSLGSLTSESKYLLASAYLLAGDRKSYQAVLPKTFGTQQAETETGGCLASFLRDKALAANALLQVDPDNPQLIELLRVISAELSKSTYFLTQESAMALLAIGKSARKAAKSDISAKISVDGKAAGAFSNKDIMLNQPLYQKTVSIAATGKGQLYYSYELSGIGSKPTPGSEDSYIKVRRRFLDRSGKEIHGNNFKQNDLLVVEISVEAESGLNIENIAITDLLPACFEIENSRLVAEREMDFMKKRATPDYIDIRDDRISFFTSAGSQTKFFYYQVRVVSKGEYLLGHVTADAMYNGIYHSRSGSGKVIVE
jgi:uncharacterized protein YfaS (alpha-2-macroglobulin family)